MGKDGTAYQLFKFLQKDVTVEQLHESTTKAFEAKLNEKWNVFALYDDESDIEAAKKATDAIKAAIKKGASWARVEGMLDRYSDLGATDTASWEAVVRYYEKATGKKIEEGKLPQDPSKVEKPTDEIQMLAEKAKKDKEVKQNKDIKTANAGITEEPEKPKVIAELEKQSPDAAKLTQGKDGLDPAVSASMKKAKEEKKIEPKVTGVEKVKEAADPKEDKVIGDYEKEEGDMEEAEGRKGMPESKDAKAVKATSAKEEKKSLEVSGMKAEKAKNESKKVNEGKVDAQEIKLAAKAVIDLGNKLNAKKYDELINLSQDELNKVGEELRIEIGYALRRLQELSNSINESNEAKLVESTLDVDEGKLPDNPAQVADPTGDIQKLAEERVLTTVSDEVVAKDLQSKYPGSRIVPDDVNGKKQFIIMVKEAAEEKHDCECGKDGDCKGNCKEGVEVTITTDDKEVNVNSQDGVTQVTTIDKAPGEDITNVEPAPAEVPVEEVNDEEDMLMAEKIYVTELLGAKKSLTEKEQAFIKEVNSIQLDEARKCRVMNKLKKLKTKKVSKLTNKK